jgi:DNA-binding GntR family transcriptional regulator
MNSAALLRDPRLYMQIAGSVLAQIEDGRFKPGGALPNIGELAEQFSVSRQTAGHALQLLADEGLVQRVPGRGYYVCEQP